MSRRNMILLLAAFVVTRLAGAWLADHPGVYRGNLIIGDPTLYASVAEHIVQRGLAPYSEVRIEYPPGSLPFILGPHLAPGSYRTALIITMLILDVAALVGLLRLAGRSGSSLGPTLWVALLPLLGPIVYLRLDMVPAVATILAAERMAAQAWFGGGAWLGFAVVSKLYPAVLLPASLIASPRRLRLAAGATVVFVVAVLPFVFSPRSLFTNVVGYHLERGIEVESLWGSLLLVARRFGHPTGLTFDFGSLNVTSPIGQTLKVLGAAAAVAGVAGGAWLAARTRGQGDVRRLIEVLFATLALVLAVGTVLSPQFVLWLIALGCAAVCWPDSGVRITVLPLVPIAFLTQAVFPFLFRRLAAGDDLALAALVTRNLLLLGTAIAAFVAIRFVGDSVDERDRIAGKGL